jgi:DNA-binding NarL/FixJ family response regulator
MSEPAAKTVLIADDQQLVRAGLRMIIEAAGDLNVVGEAVDGVDTVEQATRLRPDIVLMDVQMPKLDGIDATRHIVSELGQATRVIMLTTFSEPEIVYRALVVGASGFLLKDMPGAQLVGGIRAVARGEELLAPTITRRLIEQFVADGQPPAAPELQRLTEREREVLTLVAHGQSNAEIANELVVSVETVKTHVSRVLDKLGVRDRVQAVICAYESGVVHISSTPTVPIATFPPPSTSDS